MFIPLLWEVLQAGPLVDFVGTLFTVAHQPKVSLKHAETERGRVAEGGHWFRAGRQGNQWDLYLEQECRKCGNNRGAGALKTPR